MADQNELSDAEKMRLKRLARLGAPPVSTPTPPPAEPEAEAGPSSSTPASKPPSAASRLLSTSVPASASPAPTPKSAQAAPGPSRAKIVPEKRRAAVEPSRSNTSSPAPKPSPAATPVKPTLPYRAWESDAITIIFAATLDRKRASESDWRLCWLKGLQLELEEENPASKSPIPTPEICDRILISRLSLDTKAMSQSGDVDILTILAGLEQNQTVFDYLTGCWRRLYQKNRELSRMGYSAADKALWQKTFEQIKGLVITYCGMTLEDPTMFPQPESRPLGPAEFLPILLALSGTATASKNADPLTASSSSSVPAAAPSALSPAEIVPFLNDLANGMSDLLPDVLTPTLSLFFQNWFQIVPTPDLLGDDWRRYLGAVETLVQVKPIAAILPTLPVWVAPGVDAPKLEWQSLLGPLTRLSVYPREFPEIWKAYFSNPTERKVADIDANKSNLRHTLAALHSSLFDVYNSIVRSSPKALNDVLDFFALVLKLNEKRAGMRVDTRTVSSDGYMTNLLVILLRLFAPAMDVRYSKIDKININFYRRSSRVNIDEETRINASKENIDAQADDDSMSGNEPPNFITNLFFLANAFQHLGLIKTISTRKRAEKNISEIEKELKRAEASRPSWEGNAALAAQGEAQIKKFKSDIAILHASVHAYDTHLFDPTFTRLNVTFSTFTMTWLIRLVDPQHQYPAAPVSLPLPAEPPMAFRLLPEYFIDNIVEYLEFLAHHDPDALETPDKDVVIAFAITFLAPGYINNPFLKAKLISILANGLVPVGYYRKGTLYDRLTVLPAATDFLMPTIIRFFIDVEATGGHTQFWDKFSFRRDMSRIIRVMWDNPLHRAAFVKARHDDFDQFIKFINMLMSDTTFHLEESLTNLAKINSIETQQKNPEAWNALPDAERQDQESQLRSAEQGAPFHTHMGLDHVKLIREFTATTREPFITSEIVDRLAATLDENLATLVGPKMQELRVADPDKFGFKPKNLLATLGQIYLNLAQESDFIRAVANDGRSYSKELFEKFARILKNRAIMTDAEVAGVVAFTQKVEDMRATIMIEDEREIPDEFLDPLLSTLMKDPVILPMSRVVIDRGTIRTVLLSKELDPFNNQPLKLEDCIPDTELKAKIDAWVAEGNSATAKDVMDVDQL